MRSKRRLVALTVAVGLVVGSVVHASAQAAEGRIDVGFDGNAITLVGDSTLPSFRGAEELAIVPNFNGTFIDLTVLDDEAESGVGRALLYSDTSRCAPFRALTTRLTCMAGGVGQVRVDFSAATVATTTAVYSRYGSVSLAFKGGAGPDYVQGGDADDYILGGGGNDLLYGGGGDDFVSGGPHDDKIEGEAGRDDMRGDSGRNSIDAADGVADIRVDCGGPPEFLDYDKDLDKPVNCGSDPAPTPPGPIEPVEPPAPGSGNGTIDGEPVQVTVQPNPDDTSTVAVSTPQGPGIIAGLAWLEAELPAPTFADQTAFWAYLNGLLARVKVFFSFYLQASTISATSRSGATSQPMSTTVLVADAQGVARGDVPVPNGPPGNYTMQINTITSAGVAVTINVGVVKERSGPEPRPSITIVSAARGSGARASTITVTGTTQGLAAKAITPRYRLRGAKKWTLGKPVTTDASGAFTWRLTTPKKVSIMMVAGAVSSAVTRVPAAKRS